MADNFLVVNYMIQLNDLFIGYHGRTLNLPKINGIFKYGSMTAILGANGIGKSTFLKTLAGFLPPISGELKFNMHKRPKISYLPQKININYKFPLTVFDVVAMGCWPNIGFLQKIDKKQQDIIQKSLKCVNLDKMLKKNISMLSVGQFQCMLFARLLVQQSSLILLDEPFNNIDNKTCNLILSVINQLHKQGSTIIVVIHNYEIFIKYFPSTLLLNSKINTWNISSK